MALDNWTIATGEQLIRAGDMAVFQAFLKVHAPAMGEKLPGYVEKLIKTGNTDKAVKLWQTVAKDYVGWPILLWRALPRIILFVLVVSGLIGGCMYLTQSCR